MKLSMTDCWKSSQPTFRRNLRRKYQLRQPANRLRWAPRLSQRIPSSGTAFASGGSSALPKKIRLPIRIAGQIRRRLMAIIDLLVIKEVRQIELDVVVAEIVINKLREIGLDFF